MDVTIDKNGCNFNEKSLQDMKRLTEDIYCLCDGENKGVVMNVLISLFMHGYVQDKKTKEQLLTNLGYAYDKIIEYHKRYEDDNNN